MYALNDNTTSPSSPPAARPTRATLRTRPRAQRALIRSWEYTQPVRVAFLVFRLLSVLFLAIVGVVLLSAGYAWGWGLLLLAAAVLACGVWVFITAGKGWPVADA
ncbi:MAG TPA: hypothetical protein VMC83_03715 [Streptosporangiaceae bacterium]|nr:hypothetical protein [Streptosporangiaceae bacterium]